MIKNPDRQYDRDCNEENPDYNPGKPSFEDYKMQKLIAAFQMTYQGAPMIYYGDEVGMWGADDPHCRKPMVWDDLQYDTELIDESSGFENGFGNYTVEQNKDLLDFYKKLISIRNEYEVLKKGSVSFVYMNEQKKTFAFLRVLEKNYMVVAFNLGIENDLFEIFLPYHKDVYAELLTGKDGMMTSQSFQIMLQPESVKIYEFGNLNE